MGSKNSARVICVIAVGFFVFSNLGNCWKVVADESDGKIIAFTPEGKPAYPVPYIIPPANSSTEKQNNITPPSPVSAPSSAPSYWWKQYQNNWYHDGYAPTYFNMGSTVNGMGLGRQNDVFATPIVVSGYDTVNYPHGLAISVATSLHITFASHADFSDSAWSQSGQGTGAGIVSDGIYYWSFEPCSPQPCHKLQKYKVDDGSVAVPATVGLLISIPNIPMTYIPSTGSGQENRIYFFGVSSGGTYLFAFAADTVTYRWSVRISTSQWMNWYASPVILTVNSGPRPIVFGGPNGYLYVYDENGHAGCGYQTSGGGIYYTASIDRYYWSYLYALNSAGKLYRFQLVDDDPACGFDKWNLVLQSGWPVIVGGSQFFAAPVNAGPWVFTKAWRPITPPQGKTVITVIKKIDPIVRYQYEAASKEDRATGSAVVPAPVVANNGATSIYHIFFPSIAYLMNEYTTFMRSVEWDDWNSQFTRDRWQPVASGSNTEYYDVNTGVAIAQFPVGSTATAWYLYLHLQYNNNNMWPMFAQICLNDPLGYC